MCVRTLSRSVISDSVTSWTVACQPGTSCPWGFSRQEHWTGLPCPPPGDLPNLNSGLLHYRQILYCLSHQGSPGILEWVAYSFFRIPS